MAASTKRVLDLAGVPDYSEVVSSSMSMSEEVPAVNKQPQQPVCEFCGSANTERLQRCKQCQKGVYCSALCMADHHLAFCVRR